MYKFGKKEKKMPSYLKGQSRKQTKRNEVAITHISMEYLQKKELRMLHKKEALTLLPMQVEEDKEKKVGKQEALHRKGV